MNKLSLVLLISGVLFPLAGLNVHPAQALVTANIPQNIHRITKGEVHGQIMTGPTSPVCRVNQSCYAPYI